MYKTTTNAAIRRSKPHRRQEHPPLSVVYHRISYGMTNMAGGTPAAVATYQVRNCSHEVWLFKNSKKPKTKCCRTTQVSCSHKPVVFGSSFWKHGKGTALSACNVQQQHPCHIPLRHQPDQPGTALVSIIPARSFAPKAIHSVKLSYVRSLGSTANNHRHNSAREKVTPTLPSPSDRSREPPGC